MGIASGLSKWNSGVGPRVIGTLFTLPLARETTFRNALFRTAYRRSFHPLTTSFTAQPRPTIHQTTVFRANSSRLVRLVRPKFHSYIAQGLSRGLQIHCRPHSETKRSVAIHTRSSGPSRRNLGHMAETLHSRAVERVADDLEKPLLDNRTYRVIKLSNNLEALLIHDPDTDKAAAAMDVNVGSFSDSEDMPGIAHAVEHLLFMGTEKYPGENDYNSYLTKYAGYSNAFTSTCSTNYFFECSSTSTANNPNTSSDARKTSQPIPRDKAPLFGALDRFSQFFVHPLFLEDTLDRELRAVDSENKKNLQSDTWRLHQLTKSTSSKKHPFHKFSTGNYKVLHDDPIARGVKIRDEFMNFYHKHYSANRMKLTVLGVESLDELETWVQELFSAVPNQDLPRLRWDGIHPYSADELGTQTFAKPVMDSRVLSLEFPYPDEEQLYRSQPSQYISHLMGHEGPGSILAYIKEKGWANGLSSGVYPPCPGTSFFNIDVQLTQDGLEKYQEIIKTIFQYIAMVREQQPQEWIVSEMRKMAEVDFKFRQKAPASRTVSSLSGIMQKPFPREWLLSGQTLIRDFDAVNIKRGLDALRPDNFRFTIVSQTFPGNWDQKERWYGTEYKYEKIPPDFLREVEATASAAASTRPEGLRLPGVNEFIPKHLDVEKKDVKEPTLTPTLIRNDENVRTWFKKDDQFWVPKANIFVTLRTPMCNLTPLLCVLTALYVSLVQDTLEEYAYDAELAGLDYSLSDHVAGLDVTIHGYNDKMSVLLEKVLVSMRDLEIKQERFDIIKERKIRGLKNAEYREPFRQIGGYTRWLAREGLWNNEDLLAELETVTAQDVRVFIPQLLRQLHIEILVHGNLYKEDALNVTKLVESTMRPYRLPPHQWPTRRSVVLPRGSEYVYKRELKNADNVNHCLEYTLFAGEKTDRALRAKLMLFEKIIDEPCFDTLRTKEQLGYVVFNGVQLFGPLLAWHIIIQSERDCDYLETRCDAFLTGFEDFIRDMSDEEFAANKVGLINKRLEKLKNLTSETNRFWAHITDEVFDFELVHKDVAHIEPLTKEDVLEFFKTYIHPHSTTRAKLSVHLIAQAKGSTADDSPSITLNGATNGEAHAAAEKAILVEDVKAWKAAMPLSAGPRAVKDLSEFEEIESKL